MLENTDHEKNTPSNEEMFTNIYKFGIWKGQGDQNLKKPFYSGPGSYGTVADEYVRMLVHFIGHNIVRSITDLGCGDFAIGKKIIDHLPEITYNGCDIVPDLIEYNNTKYSSSQIKFHHLDATKDLIPVADLLTIRQVFQHLSNDEIDRILKNCNGFKFIIVTEHLLKYGLELYYNKDKQTSDGFRLTERSGVYLDKPPFNTAWTELLSCPADIYLVDPDNANQYILTEAFIKSFLITIN